MKTDPTFSVVMPLYNKAPHVARSIQSILDQTYASFELLVINDASTDGSVEEVRKFSDPRLKLLQRDTPGPGGYAARNLGIQEARGEWIAFLDADDEWLEDHLEKMVALATQFPESEFLSCGWHNVWPDGRTSQDAYFAAHAQLGAHVITFKTYLERCIIGQPPTNTYVACLRHNAHATELFPAGKAKRGGDLHAWAMYLAKARTMAWSPHIGARYNREVKNSVTQGAAANTNLLALLREELKPELEEGEFQLLLKYCNRRAWDAWRVNVFSSTGKSFNLARSLSWRGDLPFCLSRSIYSLIPANGLRLSRRLRNASRKTAIALIGVKGKT